MTARPRDEDTLPHGVGCEACQARDKGVSTEWWERGRIICPPCAPLWRLPLAHVDPVRGDG